MITFFVTESEVHLGFTEKSYHELIISKNNDRIVMKSTNPDDYIELGSPVYKLPANHLTSFILRKFYNDVSDYVAMYLDGCVSDIDLLLRLNSWVVNYYQNDRYLYIHN